MINKAWDVFLSVSPSQAQMWLYIDKIFEEIIMKIKFESRIFEEIIMEIKFGRNNYGDKSGSRIFNQNI